MGTFYLEHTGDFVFGKIDLMYLHPLVTY